MDKAEIDSLAAKAKAGDTEAFSAIFEIMAPAIYRFLAIRVVNPEDAEDLANQTFLEAWKSLPRYNQKQPFTTWIYTIARYNLIDFYRAHKAQVNLDAVMNLATTTDLEATVDVQMTTDRVLAHLRQLPEMYQTVLQLKFIEELEYSEIAKAMGKTENHVRVLAKRGLDKLKDLTKET